MAEKAELSYCATCDYLFNEIVDVCPACKKATQTRSYLQRFNIERVAFLATSAVLAALLAHANGGDAGSIMAVAVFTPLCMMSFYASSKLILGAPVPYIELVPLDDAAQSTEVGFSWLNYGKEFLFFIVLVLKLFLGIIFLPFRML